MVKWKIGSGEGENLKIILYTFMDIITFEAD